MSTTRAEDIQPVVDDRPVDTPEPVAVTPGPTGNSSRFQPTPEPKNKQFTARATEKEAARIQAFIIANGCTDIARLTLKVLDSLENDAVARFLTAIKTK